MSIRLAYRIAAWRYLAILAIVVCGIYVCSRCRRSRSRRRSRVRRFVEVAVEGNQPAMGEIAGQSPADSCNHCLYTRHVWPKMSLIASGGEVAEVAVEGCNNCNSCRGWLCMLAPWRGNEQREKSAIPPLTARRGKCYNSHRIREPGSLTPAEYQIAEPPTNDLPAPLGLCVRA